MKSWWLWLALWLGAGFAAAQPAATPTRLAVVVEDPSAAPAADLLTAELSRKKDIALFERAEIERIYREQQISAANQNYLQLGDILGADGLLMLDTVKLGTNLFLDFRFIAVKPGVVLASEQFPWSRATGPDWAAGIVRFLGPIIPKASVLGKDAIPLSIVSLRSAIQTEESRELERQMTLLLSERLSRQREVFVLERRKLQVLSAEKELKGMDDSAFWNGSVLLEGTLDRDGYSTQTLTVNTRLVPPRGGAPQTLELKCSRTNLVAAVNQLAEQILAALKLKPAEVPWNPADEADKFFSDASWAYRWGLLGQAQAASEAAWALGKRTEPVAQLRIRAYADDGWPYHTWSGNLEIPGLPEPAKLQPLLRALELFGHDYRVVFTNGARLNEEWFMDGLQLFRESAAMLDGFYHWAELTEAHQAELAETRLLTREALSLLETQPPKSRAELEKRVLRGRSAVQEFRMFDLAKWHEGGLLYERQEDSLPLYRSMLEAGYAPPALPRIVGWNWQDRKNAPKVLRQFIDELSASTNPATRLGGLTLALLKTPFYPEADFHEKENALVAAIWDCRAWVLSSADHAAVVESTERLLRDKYSDADVNSYFAHEPFAGMRFRLEKEFLLSSTNFDNTRFQAVFPHAFQKIPPEQAREIATAFEPLAQKSGFAAVYRDRFRAQGGQAALASAPPPPPAMPAEQPLVAKFVRWHLGGAAAGDARRPHFERLVVRNDRLWALVAFLGEYEVSGFHGPDLCASVDPQTGACDEIHFPERLGRPGERFDATKDALYLSAQDHLERYRFANRTWESLAVPIEGGAEVVALGGQLYLANGSGVLEVDPGTLATRILGSARREPPANDLDALLNSTTYVYPRIDGSLGFMGSNRFLAYMPASQTWKPGPVIPPAVLRVNRIPVFSPAGALLRTDDGYFKRQLLAFWNDQPAMELLLEQPHPLRGARPAPRADGAAAATRWEWPPAFDLNAACVLSQGSNLWVLTPRKVWNDFGVSMEEPVRFSDSRQATLFRFEDGSRRPLSIPVSFENSGIEPFEPRKGGYSFLRNDRRRAGEIPFWLDTPAGLVFSEPALGGHWLIPRAALETRLTMLRAKPRTGNAQAIKPIRNLTEAKKDNEARDGAAAGEPHAKDAKDAAQRSRNRTARPLQSEKCSQPLRPLRPLCEERSVPI